MNKIKITFTAQAADVTLDLTKQFVTELRDHSQFFKGWTVQPNGELACPIAPTSTKELEYEYKRTLMTLSEHGWKIYDTDENSSYLVRMDHWPLRVRLLNGLTIKLLGDVLEKEFPGQAKIRRVLRVAEIPTQVIDTKQPHGVKLLALPARLGVKLMTVAKLVEATLRKDSRDNPQLYFVDPFAKSKTTKAYKFGGNAYIVEIDRIQYTITQTEPDQFNVVGRYTWTGVRDSA